MMVCLAMSMDCVFGFAVGSSSLISPRRNLVSGVTLRHGAVSRVAFGGMRMDGSSGEKDDKDDELLMASLRKRMPVAAEDEKFKLPTADQMDYRDVTKKVIQALMDNDNPHENAGTEMLIAYSSPFAKKMDPWRFESPANMASKLAGDPDACCVLRCQDFRITSERDQNRCQNFILSVDILPEEGPWTSTCFCLTRVESRWLIDHIGRAAA